MRDQVKSGGLNNSRVTTSAFDKLTKAELIELISGDIKAPITPAELYRCAVSIVAKWCDNVLTGRYSSVESVSSKLDCLERIYKNR